MLCRSTKWSGCVYVKVPLSHNENFNQPHYSLTGYKYNLLTYKGNISCNSQEIATGQIAYFFIFLIDDQTRGKKKTNSAEYGTPSPIKRVHETYLELSFTQSN